MITKRVYISALVLSLFCFSQLFLGCASGPGSKADTDPAQPGPLINIDSVVASETAEAVSVVISSDRDLTYSSLKPDPTSVVLIFPETTVESLPRPLTLDSDFIPRVVASQVNGSRTARLEFKLAADVQYTATKEGKNVRLLFNKTAVETGAAAMPDSAEAIPEAAETETAAAVSAGPSRAEAADAQAPTETIASSIDAPAKTAWVNKIDFLSESEGKSTLVLGTTHAVNYRIRKVAPRKIEILLLNTRIPSYRQRALITTRFTSAVNRIVPYQRSKERNESVVSVELREAVPYVAEQADSLLLVHFEASGVPPKPLEQAQLPPWKQEVVSGQMAPVTAAEAPAVSEPSQPPADREKTLDEAAADLEQLYQQDRELQSILAPGRKKYTGEKIALDFYDTDIKNVFRILREVSGKNFAIDKDVAGKVTMSLDKPVPWDQVLDLVLRMNQLGQVFEGDIVRIATLETLKKEDDLRKAKLESMRKAREEARALEPMITMYIPVSYSNAKDEVKPHIEKILTDKRGSVTVDEKNNQIIITDTVPKIRQAQEIIRRIDKVTSQVIIEARVVEVSSDFSRQLGITWGGTYGPGVIDGTGYNTSTDVAINLPSESISTMGISFSRLSGVPFVLNAQINALETTGEGRILSAPKILTLDNKKAKIKQGLEFPYLERDSSGGSSVKFKNIDLLLEVTPHVTPDNRISLVIFITKNDVDTITDGVPSVATNEAETELLINDGDTIVIGGIIKKSETQAQGGWPGLSKIPILGWLFKNDTKRRQHDELLIFITPRIVQLEQVAAN
jgi:type IV pilus assembly protein PilQ